MDILFAAGEAVPFCKTGGLADVVGALGQALGRMGHRVCLFLPAYRAVEETGRPLKRVSGRYWVPVGEQTVPATLLAMDWGAATAYFVEHPGYFHRDGLYQESGKDYEDNDERFVFFARAALEGAKYVGFKPEVVHAHDWQAGLLPAYLKTLYRTDGFYARAASVITIHNIAYQGMFSKDALFLAGFGWADFTPERLEYYGGFNFLKAGLVFADVLTTVSPTYASEIRSSPDFGRGLEGVLRHRSSDLVGILNGIDTRAWDPATDPRLARNFGPSDARAGKAANKAALRKECGLASGEGPLLGIVSRLDLQKGLDVVLALVPRLLERGVQLAVLGTGDSQLQQGFARAAVRHRKAVHFRADFDEPFAHRVYAASDLFLMPSRFEPCGLGQLIAMRYGALPVVTRTGGLADTVREAPAEGPANGFAASRCSPEEYGAALDRALDAWADSKAWEAMMANAMGRDSSWERSAGLYVDVYRRAEGSVNNR